MTDAPADRRAGFAGPAQTTPLGAFVRPQTRVDSEGKVSEAPVNGAGSILSEAAAIVEGSRNQQHGEKERSFAAIANLWDAYLDNRKPPGPGASLGIRPRDVAVMMVLMKVMRAEWGMPIRDHYVDMAGYAGIAGELSFGVFRGGTPEG